MVSVSWISVILFAASCTAQNPDPSTQEPLPPPRVIVSPIHVSPPAFVRPNRYDVWQNYGVDRYGRFRPLVIGSPYGHYYFADGKPYPWALMHSLHWLPYISH